METDDMPVKVYMAGAVEQCPKDGIEWRQHIVGIMRGANNLVPVWPPTLAPGVTADYARIRADDELWRTCVIRPDLEAMLGCQVVLLRLCPLCRLGTLGETCVALWARLPIVWWQEGCSDLAGIPKRILDVLQYASHLSIGSVRSFSHPEKAISAISM